MAEIPLTQGKVTLVDAADYEWLSQWKWHATKGRTTWYARRTLPRKDGRYLQEIMHRVILGVSDPSIDVDHWDHNGLNNTRANLRTASSGENQSNARLHRDNNTGYKGVTKHPGERAKPWQARIGVNGKMVSLGYFHTKVEAAIAYDAGARRYFGEFALTNFPAAKP